MAHSTENSFVDELITQIAASLHNKIEQLNERKLILEKYLSLNLPDVAEIDVAKARAKLDEVVDSLRYEERFQKHFVEINNDLRVYKELAASKHKLEREETIREGLKLGLEYLDVLNSFFSNQFTSNIPHDLLKAYEVNMSEYSALKSFNQMMQSERSQCFDVNVDHLACLVNASGNKVNNLNVRYSDLKDTLDRIIRKKSFFSKYSNDYFKSTNRPISPILINAKKITNTVNTNTSTAVNAVGATVVSPTPISKGGLISTNNNTANLSKVTSIKLNISSETNKPILKLTSNKIKDINNSMEVTEININESKENESKKTFPQVEQKGSQNDVIYNDVNLTKLGHEMEHNFTREAYAYTLAKILFSRDERLNGWFADINHPHSSKNKRVPFDSERVKILKSALNSTKFKLSSDQVEANLEWNQLRRNLNKKISKNLKKKQQTATN